MSLKKADIALMGMCTGLIVANLYYCQPLVMLIAKSFHIAPAKAGSINYITQIGYAAGLLFLVPLGDLMERKRQILFTCVLIVISLCCAAMASSFVWLQIASFLLGFTTVVPQLILPLAAALSAPERRGKVIGSVMSGLLLGILLSRTISGLIGGWLGWRAVFWIAAGICSLLLIIMAVRFPRNQPHFDGTYKDLMRSLLSLLPQPVLQEACFVNAMTFGTFGAFWTVMVIYLGGAPFHFSTAQIGLFGLAGAAGASAAPLAGRISDKGNPRNTILVGLFMLLVSFAMFYVFRTSLAGIIAAIIVLDFGVQAVHVSNQTRVYALIPSARNRLNTIYMTITFIGTAAGSAFGLWLWNIGGWPAFCLGCGGIIIIALGIYAVYHKKISSMQQALS